MAMMNSRCVLFQFALVIYGAEPLPISGKLVHREIPSSSTKFYKERFIINDADNEEHKRPESSARMLPKLMNGPSQSKLNTKDGETKLYPENPLKNSNAYKKPSMPVMSSETVKTNDKYRRDSGTLRDQRRDSGTLRDHRRGSGTLRDHRRDSGTLRDHRRDSGTLRDHRRDSGTLRDHGKCKRNKRSTKTEEDYVGSLQENSLERNRDKRDGKFLNGHIGSSNNEKSKRDLETLKYHSGSSRESSRSNGINKRNTRSLKGHGERSDMGSPTNLHSSDENIFNKTKKTISLVTETTDRSDEYNENRTKGSKEDQRVSNTSSNYTELENEYGLGLSGIQNITESSEERIVEENESFLDADSLINKDDQFLHTDITKSESLDVEAMETERIRNGNSKSEGKSIDTDVGETVRTIKGSTKSESDSPNAYAGETDKTSNSSMKSETESAHTDTGETDKTSEGSSKPESESQDTDAGEAAKTSGGSSESKSDSLDTEVEEIDKTNSDNSESENESVDTEIDETHRTNTESSEEKRLNSRLSERTNRETKNIFPRDIRNINSKRSKQNFHFKGKGISDKQALTNVRKKSGDELVTKGMTHDNIHGAHEKDERNGFGQKRQISVKNTKIDSQIINRDEQELSKSLMCCNAALAG